jgi:glucose-1-phosphate adenylyltransferase
MGIFRFDDHGQVTGFEEKPNEERLAEMGSSAPSLSPVGDLSADRPFVASMGIYVFSRDVLYDVLAASPRRGLRARDHSARRSPRIRCIRSCTAGYWADVGTVQSFYDVNLMLTRRKGSFNFFHPKRPIYTRTRFLPAARIHDSHMDEALVAEGAYLDNL